MSSARRSDPRRPQLLDQLDRDLPTGAADVEALRTLRERTAVQFPDLSELPGVAAALARRPTSEGWEELTL